MERLYVIVQHKGVCDHNGEGLRDGPREVLHTSECTCHSSNKNTFFGGGDPSTLKNQGLYDFTWLFLSWLSMDNERFVIEEKESRTPVSRGGRND